MKFKVLLVVLSLCMLASGCSTNPSNEDVNTVSGEGSAVEEETILGKNSTAVSDVEMVVENSFKASGSTTIDDFIQNANSMGYEVARVDSSASYVTSKVNVGESPYTIGYLISGENGISMVEVVAENTEMLESEGYLNCVYAMAKSLKPSIDEEKLRVAVENALNGDIDQVVEEDMMFIFYARDNSLAIFH